MMTKNTNIISIIAVTVSIIIIIGVIATTYLEPYENTKYVNPSKESKENIYFAFDKWLLSTGHNTRILENANVNALQECPENVIIIFVSCFDFLTNEDANKFYDIVSAGKIIVIFNDTYNKNLSLFLDDVLHDDNKDDELSDDNTEKDKTIFDDFYIDVVQAGNGRLYISDSYYFMQTKFIKEERNAEISWLLSGGLDTDGSGILIVRSMDISAGKTPKGKNSNENKSLWNAAKEKGALNPILISTVALVVFGFWMCLITFGKSKNIDDTGGKTITERFLAEGRFLKRNNALNVYLKYLDNEKQDKKITVKDLKELLEKKGKNEE